MLDFIRNVFNLITENTFTKGCALGLVYVGLLWLIVEIIRLYFYMRRRNSLISVSSGNDGNFLLSYKAIKSHLKLLITRDFKQVTLDNILIERKSDSYALTLTIQVGGNMDLKALGESIHDAVKNTLENVVGLPGVFTHIDVVISNLRADRNASAASALTPSTAQPEKTVEDKPAEVAEQISAEKTEQPMAEESLQVSLTSPVEDEASTSMAPSTDN